MIYRIDSFSESRINPITNCEYDSSWIVLILTDSNKYSYSTGSTDGCAYSIKISRLNCKNWMMNIGDLLSFNEENHKNIILVMSENDYAQIIRCYIGHKHNEDRLRKYEPSVLVHSTSTNSWHRIKQDGMLKCWNRLRAENSITETHPIGKLLGDPIDFSDYIMLGNGIAGEIVVSSRQKGEIVPNIDTEYQTGVRLYFDAERIALDGRLIRDGIHFKVKDTLPLDPYLIWVSTWNTVGLTSPISTPRIYTEHADFMFHTLQSKHLCESKKE